jgi:hypothetical protein
MPLPQPRRALLALATTCLLAGPALALDLITPTEAARDRDAEAAQTASPVFRAKAFTPGAPLIEVRQPGRLEGIKAPFPIQLGFKGSDGAELDLKSFRVLYGFLKLDITARLLEKARLTADGLVLDDAAIPSGSHRLRIQLKDSKGREGELDVVLKVL